MKYNEHAPFYVKENMYDYLRGFLESYSLSELLEILADVVDTIEREKAEDE